MALELSYVAADTSAPLLDLTVGALLRRAAELAPHRTAFVEGTADGPARRRVTYSELLRTAEAGARGLLARFQPGDHVAIMAPNRPEWTLFQFSAALAGLVVVMHPSGAVPSHPYHRPR